MKIYLISKRKAGWTIAGVLTLALMFMLIPAQPLPNPTVLSYGVANKVIIIDPGHGGLDQGATRGKYIESDITLQISKKLAQNLSQAGAMVIMLRENESDLAGDEFTGTIGQHKREDMKKRVAKANQARADLYISIHTNAVPNTVWTGAQTFYKPNDDFYRQHCRGKLQPVLDTVEKAATATHVEVTTLLIPGENDAPEEISSLARWLASLNKSIPLHLSRYHPAYKFTQAATTAESLQIARELAREHLNFVYLGNIPGEENSTPCLNCGEVLVKRSVYEVEINALEDGHCRHCGDKIDYITSA
jgi:N-acetylmuramoyl-L-alanine amidase